MEKRHTAKAVEKKVKATVLLAFAKGQGALVEEPLEFDAGEKEECFFKARCEHSMAATICKRLRKPSEFNSY